jgi:hypothetical protein
MTCDCCGFDYTCAGESNPLIRGKVENGRYREKCYLCLSLGLDRLMDEKIQPDMTIIMISVAHAANTVLAELEVVKAELKELRDKS